MNLPLHIDRAKGMAVVGSGTLVISVDALLIRLAHTESWNVIFWRGVFMALSLGTLLFIRQGRRMADSYIHGGWAALFSALLFGLGSTAFVSSVMFTKVANTVVIISSAPLFAALFTWLLRIEIVPLRTWLAICSAFFGVGVVFAGSLGGGGLLGDAIAVLNACVVGGNLTLLRHHQVLDRLPLVCLGGLVMALLSLPFAEPFQVSGIGFLVLVLMGLVQMPLALSLIAQSTRYLPSPEVSLFLLVETILSPIWVWLVLGEMPPQLTYAGGTIVILTLLIHSWLGLREWSRAKRVCLHASRAQTPSPPEG